MKTIAISSLPGKNWIAFVLLAVALLVMVWGVYTFLPVHADANPPLTYGMSVDWKGCIRPDALTLISGGSPYAEGCGLNPPWTYLVISPIAALPPAVGAAVMFVLTYVLYSFVLFRLGAKPLVILAFIACRFALSNAYVGNLDAITALGFVLPPQIGLFFVVMKPQIGVGIALFWLVEAWRAGRVREVARVFAPVTLAYLASFALYGFWPLRLLNMPADAFNAHLWPFGVPVGIALLYKAIRDRNKLFAMAAAPFLAPYVNMSSLAVALLPFMPYEFPFILAVVFTWL